ncbi:MAG: NUDIX hydrolase [Gammaproteobacteria bacterium]|nr:NUDIX hydrolase [Gammaproteobacteria bacterium]MDH3414153.1 NUDIX hydrolase [Gammaproteobacteria bacterium]
MTQSARNSRPAVTTNVVVFTLRDDKLKLLLVRRRSDPFKGMWALPGGYVQVDEDLDHSAMRALEDSTGVTGVYLEQLYTFGAPDRDPRDRAISIAYYALVPSERLQLRTAGDTEAVGWFALEELEPLAFDHNEMVNVAHHRLSAKLAYSTIALQFMPEKFTLSDLQRVYERILNEKLDKRNFRKRVLALDQINQTQEVRRNGSHRPARLYRVKNPGEVQIIR